ncbi:MAG: hypothetical protein ACYTGP_07400 [Planctomycetota bacterium]|jgi:hypothetical protein
MAGPRISPALVMLLCLALVAHPAVAETHRAGRLESAPAHAPPDLRRLHVYAQLVELDYAPLEARDAVAELTEADLDVLCANPDMLQRAGAMSVQTQAFIIAAIIVTVIVLLATSSNSSTFVMVN